MTLGLASVHAPPRTKLLGPETARVVGDGPTVSEKYKRKGVIKWRLLSLPEPTDPSNAPLRLKRMVPGEQGTIPARRGLHG